MKKKIRCSFIICCIAAMVVVGIFAGSGTSLAAPGGKAMAWSASAGKKIAEKQVQDADGALDGDSSEAENGALTESGDTTSDGASMESTGANESAGQVDGGEQDAESVDDGELVIVEVQDTETPAANVQVEQEQPSYLLLAACLAAAVAVLVVLLILLRVKYGRLKQQVRRLEDEIAQLYAKNM